MPNAPLGDNILIYLRIDCFRTTKFLDFFENHITIKANKNLRTVEIYEGLF